MAHPGPEPALKLPTACGTLRASPPRRTMTPTVGAVSLWEGQVPLWIPLIARTCVFRDTRPRTQISALRTEQEGLVTQGECGPEVRGAFHWILKACTVATISLPHRTLDTGSAFTHSGAWESGEVRALSLRHPQPSQGGGRSLRAAARSSLGSASPAWPPRRGFHTWPTTGQQGSRENRPVSKRPAASVTGHRSGEAAGARVERGSAVRSCWCAWTMAEAREGIGAPGQAPVPPGQAPEGLFRLPNADVLLKRACLPAAGPQAPSRQTERLSVERKQWDGGHHSGSLNDLTVRFNSSTTFSLKKLNKNLRI